MTSLTPEMNQLFMRRTTHHIGLVRMNLLSMLGFHGLTALELETRALAHDTSKFSDKERDGYTWLTWIYHSKKNGISFVPSEQILEIIESSMVAHRTVNYHHPEAHEKIGGMQTLDIVEMICDWHAISLENGRGVIATRQWAKDNIGRWSFLKSQMDLIYETIDRLGQTNS